MSTETSQPTEASSTLPPWYPTYRGKPVYYGNAEALGWVLDSVARSVQNIGAGAFLGTALLRLAREHVGCPTEVPEGENKLPECNERVYGLFKPSSLLTTYTIVVGLVSSALLPLAGSIVDFTPHRLKAGRILSTCFCILIFPQIFLNDNTWFAIAILQMAVAFIGWAQTMVTYAYLPELTSSEQQLNEFTQNFTVVSFAAMVIYLVVIIGIASLFQLGDTSTARLAQSISLGNSILLLYPAWFRLLQTRPAAHELLPRQTMWTAGFSQVYRTSIHIYRHLPSLKWFYISVALIDAAINSLVTITITYLTDTLLFTSQENGIAIMSVLLGSIPGAYLAGQASKLFNPVRTSIGATLVLLLNTIVVAIVLDGPNQQTETYLLAGIWGLATGGKWTVDRTIASTVIPVGQDAELMGIYLFAGQILTWLPPLIFTLINELSISQRIGIGSLAVWFFFGILSLILMGSYRDAVVSAGRGAILAEPRRGTSVNEIPIVQESEQHYCDFNIEQSISENKNRTNSHDQDEAIYFEENTICNTDMDIKVET